MQILEFYKLANASQKKNENTTIYNPQNGHVTFCTQEKKIGGPCASPLDFNRRTKRALLDMNKKK